MNTKHDELALDHHFWNKISTDHSFQTWFCNRTKFADKELDLVTDEKWHQRWYKDPETGKDSETDILLLFRDRTTRDRYAIHIENKPDHRKWEINQAEQYRKRAINRMLKIGYVDFQTALVAPLTFLARWPTESAHFDLLISYEDISVFVPQFAI